MVRNSAGARGTVTTRSLDKPLYSTPAVATFVGPTVKLTTRTFQRNYPGPPLYPAHWLIQGSEEQFLTHEMLMTSSTHLEHQPLNIAGLITPESSL
eukprot:236379-Hanusia_phi.AAC.1